MDIYDLRQDYTKNSLDEDGVCINPFKQFELWFNECLEQQIHEPYAMAISSVDEQNKPHVRIVLMRSFSEQGIKFFTNYHSAKGKHFQHNPYVEVLFFWQNLERQVRISGGIEKLTAKENQEYFAKRPLNSQIGACISPQSKVIPNREVLKTSYQELSAISNENNQPHCPEFWGGYIIIPQYFEFWQGRASRLHDRIIYTKQPENNDIKWLIQRLAP